MAKTSSRRNYSRKINNIHIILLIIFWNLLKNKKKIKNTYSLKKLSINERSSSSIRDSIRDSIEASLESLPAL